MNTYREQDTTLLKIENTSNAVKGNSFVEIYHKYQTISLI